MVMGKTKGLVKVSWISWRKQKMGERENENRKKGER